MPRVRNLARLGCLSWLSALMLCVFSAQGQTVIYVVDTSYFNTAMVQLSSAIDGQVNSIISMQGTMVANTTTLGSGLAGINAQIAAQAGVMASAAGSLAAIANALASMENIAPSITALKTSVDGLKSSVDVHKATLTANGTKLDLNTTAINNFGIQVTAALANNANLLSPGINTTIPFKLDQIRDTLLTNGMGTNSITINTTNGAMSFTNNINVNVPDLGFLSTFAVKAVANTDTVSNMMSQIPTDLASLTATAEALNPLNTMSLPDAATIAIDSPGADFLKFTFYGGHVVDFNPMSHFPNLTTGIKTLFEWVLMMSFLAYCGKLGHEAAKSVGVAQQMAFPNISILGNSIGALIIPVYVGLFLVASAAFVLVFTKLVDQGLFANLGLNPFSGIAADSLTLANMFFPVAAAVGQIVWLVVARWTLASFTLVFNVCLRLLPSS